METAVWEPTRFDIYRFVPPPHFFFFGLVVYLGRLQKLSTRFIANTLDDRTREVRYYPDISAKKNSNDRYQQKVISCG